MHLELRSETAAAPCVCDMALRRHAHARRPYGGEKEAGQVKRQNSLQLFFWERRRVADAESCALHVVNFSMQGQGAEELSMGQTMMRVACGVGCAIVVRSL
jgi:hypothetical protein